MPVFWEVVLHSYLVHMFTMGLLQREPSAAIDTTRPCLYRQMWLVPESALDRVNAKT